MTDKDILIQLLNGNHLEKDELKRAKELLHQLQTLLSWRVQ